MDKSAGLLANRILMLEAEEQKILSKITKTRKKADEIEKHRVVKEKKMKE